MLRLRRGSTCCSSLGARRLQHTLELALLGSWSGLYSFSVCLVTQICSSVPWDQWMAQLSRVFIFGPGGVLHRLARRGSLLAALIPAIARQRRGVGNLVDLETLGAGPKGFWDWVRRFLVIA
jgi:hypothetical protein